MYKRFRAESLVCKGRFGFVGEHVIDKPVFYGLWCGEVVVATAPAQDFACGDLDIGSLTFCPAERLMDQHSGVWQTETFALCTSSQQYCAHAHGHANADG